MIYITGDTHGNFRRIERFCSKNNTTINDIMIILGDAGINYYGEDMDKKLKKKLSKLPITIFSIHGNHEIRPQNIPSYITAEKYGGKVFVEEKYPNLLFAHDGEIYDFDDKKCIVIGGAYSVDKFYRLRYSFGWWEDEQPSEETKSKVEAVLAKENIDIVLSHTCPLKYEPVEVFLSFIDQTKVDKSTEVWLDKIENDTDYKKWYCGHYHTVKRIDKMQFMFENIDELKI